jgi:hypothetical protein
MNATMETEKIEILKKITLSVEAGTAPDSMVLTLQSSQFERKFRRFSNTWSFFP